jgi:hypothetical protein
MDLTVVHNGKRQRQNKTEPRAFVHRGFEISFERDFDLRETHLARASSRT